MRTSITKLANENLLAASTLAEDVIERIRRKSVDDFDGLAALIGSNDTIEIPFNSSTFADQFYPQGPLPQVLNRLPGAKDSSSIIFEVLQRTSSSVIEKISAKAIIKWKEAKGWSAPEDGGNTVRNVQEQEYVLRINLARSGLRVFLK